jgi:hypothetical protein
MQVNSPDSCTSFEVPGSSARWSPCRISAQMIANQCEAMQRLLVEDSTSLLSFLCELMIFGGHKRGSHPVTPLLALFQCYPFRFGNSRNPGVIGRLTAACFMRSNKACSFIASRSRRSYKLKELSDAISQALVNKMNYKYYA